MTLIPPPPADPSLPKAYGGCQCSCHKQPGVMHVMACCGPSEFEIALERLEANGAGPGDILRSMISLVASKVPLSNEAMAAYVDAVTLCEQQVPAEYDIRKLMLAVVPGDGSGQEVYATSVKHAEEYLAKEFEREEERLEALRKERDETRALQQAAYTRLCAANNELTTLRAELVTLKVDLDAMRNLRDQAIADRDLARQQRDEQGEAAKQARARHKQLHDQFQMRGREQDLLRKEAAAEKGKADATLETLRDKEREMADAHDALTKLGIHEQDTLTNGDARFMTLPERIGMCVSKSTVWASGSPKGWGEMGWGEMPEHPRPMAIAMNDGRGHHVCVEANTNGKIYVATVLFDGKVVDQLSRKEIETLRKERDDLREQLDLKEDKVTERDAVLQTLRTERDDAMADAGGYMRTLSQIGEVVDEALGPKAGGVVKRVKELAEALTAARKERDDARLTVGKYVSTLDNVLREKGEVLTENHGLRDKVKALEVELTRAKESADWADTITGRAGKEGARTTVAGLQYNAWWAFMAEIMHELGLDTFMINADANVQGKRVEEYRKKVKASIASLVMRNSADAKQLAAFEDMDFGRMAPVPVTIQCPKCSAWHVDEDKEVPWGSINGKDVVPSATGSVMARQGDIVQVGTRNWAKHPHSTHRCAQCQHEWMPFPIKVPTVGVMPREREPGVSDAYAEAKVEAELRLAVDASQDALAARSRECEHLQRKLAESQSTVAGMIKERADAKADAMKAHEARRAAEQERDAAKDTARNVGVELDRARSDWRAGHDALQEVWQYLNKAHVGILDGGSVPSAGTVIDRAVMVVQTMNGLKRERDEAREEAKRRTAGATLVGELGVEISALKKERDDAKFDAVKADEVRRGAEQERDQIRADYKKLEMSWVDRGRQIKQLADQLDNEIKVTALAQDSRRKAEQERDEARKILTDADAILMRTLGQVMWANVAHGVGILTSRLATTVNERDAAIEARDANQRAWDESQKALTDRVVEYGRLKQACDELRGEKKRLEAYFDQATSNIQRTLTILDEAGETSGQAMSSRVAAIVRERDEWKKLAIISGYREEKSGSGPQAPIGVKLDAESNRLIGRGQGAVGLTPDKRDEMLRDELAEQLAILVHLHLAGKRVKFERALGDWAMAFYIRFQSQGDIQGPPRITRGEAMDRLAKSVTEWLLKHFDEKAFNEREGK